MAATRMIFDDARAARARLHLQACIEAIVRSAARWYPDNGRVSARRPHGSGGTTSPEMEKPPSLPKRRGWDLGATRKAPIDRLAECRGLSGLVRDRPGRRRLATLVPATAFGLAVLAGCSSPGPGLTTTSSTTTSSTTTTTTPVGVIGTSIERARVAALAPGALELPTISEGSAAWLRMVPVAYRSFGSGPDLLLISGQDGTLTWWGQTLLSDLSGHYRVTVFDLPGAGYSASPTAPLSVAWLADMTAGFALTVGLSDPIVLGWGLGGQVALCLAERHPGFASSLVLVDTSAGGPKAVKPSADVACGRFSPTSGHAGRSVYGPVPTDGCGPVGQDGLGCQPVLRTSRLDDGQSRQGRVSPAGCCLEGAVCVGPAADGDDPRARDNWYRRRRVPPCERFPACCSIAARDRSLLPRSGLRGHRRGRARRLCRSAIQSFTAANVPPTTTTSTTSSGQ